MMFRKKITGFLFFAAIISQLLYAQSYFEVSRLSFNTRSKELAPAFYHNDLVFCSDKRNELLISRTDLNSNVFTNLYQVNQKKPGKFENPKLMATELTTHLFEGSATFSRDFNMVYYTRTINVAASIRNRNRPDSTFGIFTAKLVNGEWSSLSQFNFNSAAYNTGYPFLSDDGKQLFFCSDAPGGMGKLDIYVANLENDQWGRPENLGPAVNTTENEVFPFLHKDGKLYFASRGHNLSGDLDIYYTVSKDGEWLKPVPLSEPFNTPGDDYGLILNASSDTGYFVSDRDGSDDIFAAYSTMPTFNNCIAQQENEYCYVFYEPNNIELDTTAFAYQWDLGDGTFIRALQAEHCFARPDTYLVQLNIIDKLTNEVMLSQATNRFVVEKIEQPYIQSPDTVIAGEEIVIDGRESFLTNFTIDQYYWNFGDSFRASGIETKHIFAIPGTYQITLGVAGQNGNPAVTNRNTCVIRKIVVVNSKK